jgi:hypothetical protein
VLGPAGAVSDEPLLRDPVEHDVQEDRVERAAVERASRLLGVLRSNELRAILGDSLERARVLEAVFDDEDPRASHRATRIRRRLTAPARPRAR